MSINLTSDDLAQVAAMGISAQQVEQQVENFRQGFPKTHLLEAATVDNGGILRLTDEDINRYTGAYGRLSRGKRILKFVPASGAATRMFKDLYTFSASYFGVDKGFEREYPSVKEFLEHIRSFAFFADLEATMKRAGADFEDYMERGDFTSVVNFLLQPQYMGYGVKPKGMLKFHKYGDLSRTALEEHIVEGIEYAQSSDGEVHIHFTVSPEHRDLFRRKVQEVKKYYEGQFGVKLRISFSEQKHYTDTIAVDEQNNPVRDGEGRLTFRPGGHGALIENLNEQRADLIFVKNIDNVVPDWMKHTTIIYKKALAGLLLELQEEVFKHLRTLDAHPTKAQLTRIERFVGERLRIELAPLQEVGERIAQLRSVLHRPMRVCGMVKNQGEPGGGPFFIEDSRGVRSLQVVETAQINRNDPQQEAILSGATHFNPVDLVCATRDYKGRRFDLRQYVDPATGFISKKSKGAQVVKSQELPGLWNGAMAHWTTLFVEVPLATFNPVKTVNDLLRKEHQ